MEIALTEESRRLLARLLERGNYADEGAAIEEGLRRLERERRREKLEAEIQVGLDQANRGELLDGDEVFAELSAEYEPAEVHPPIRADLLEIREYIDCDSAASAQRLGCQLRDAYVNLAKMLPPNAWP